MKKSFLALLMVSLCMLLMACGSEKKEKVLIYSSAEDYRIEYLNERLKEKFPQYEIVIEYMSTGNNAAKLMAEVDKTECDIINSLEYGYLEQLSQAGILADLKKYDFNRYTNDVVLSKDYIAELRNGGAIIVNTKVLNEKGLPKPESYDDLLKTEYKGLISMPNPKASGTGYMFVKSLVNTWGEAEAFRYFDKLTPNILQYTSSGSGPVNALANNEVCIGMGMTAQAVTQINKNVPLEIIYFKEGSPYSLYGNAMIKGKSSKECVKKVFDFIVDEYNYDMNAKFFPEKIYKEKSFVVKNYPTNINYANMQNNSINEKIRLLDKWKY